MVVSTPHETSASISTGTTQPGSTPFRGIEREDDRSKTYHKAIKEEKNDHWKQWLEEATEKTLWTAHKYVANAPSDIAATHIPTLVHRGMNAETNEEKANVLKETLFPPPPTAQ